MHSQMQHEKYLQMQKKVTFSASTLLKNTDLFLQFAIEVTFIRAEKFV